MTRERRTPSFEPFRSTSEAVSKVHSASSRKKDTEPELLLRSAAWRLGLRFRLHRAELPGHPDIVFPGARVAVFCDGDFWHGRDWRRRRRKLARGANADYWLAKIASNRARDRRTTRALERLGWTVVRVWESEVRGDAAKVARMLAAHVWGAAPPGP